jgi:hypothetical protein
MQASVSCTTDKVQEVIDLIDLDGTSAASAAAAAAAAVVTAPKRKQPETISFLDVEDPTEEYQKQYVLNITKENKKRSRLPRNKSKRLSSVSTAAASADAIDIESFSSKDDAAASYRRLLGPLRFNFVDRFCGAHAFITQTQHAKLKAANIYREFLEYKLNLPIELSSSIFVRTLESRLDIARALITGMYIYSLSLIHIVELVAMLRNACSSTVAPHICFVCLYVRP